MRKSNNMIVALSITPMSILLCIIVGYSWLSLCSASQNEAFCNIYNDPLIKPFGSNRVVQLTQQVMYPPGRYVLMSNDQGRCPLRRGQSTWPRMSVLAEVGPPLDNLQSSPTGYSVNALLIELPAVNYNFRIDKDEKLNVKLPSDPANTFSLSPSLPYYIHFGGNGDNYVNIRLDDSAGSGRYLLFETGAGFTAGIRGYYNQGQKWGRVKLIIPDEKLNEMCGLCDLRSYAKSYQSSAPLFSATSNEVLPFVIGGISQQTWQRWTNSPSSPNSWGLGSSQTRVGNSGSTRSTGTTNNNNGWVAWSSQRWAGTGSNIINPTTRPRAWVNWASQAWTGTANPSQAPRAWVRWADQSWSGVAGDVMTRSPRGWVNWASQSWSGTAGSSSRPRGKVSWSNNVNSANRRRRIANIADFEGLPVEISQFLANQNAGNEVEILGLINWLSRLFSRQDVLQGGTYTVTDVERKQPNTVNNDLEKTAILPEPEVATKHKPVVENSGSPGLGLFNPFHGFDLNEFIKPANLNSTNANRNEAPESFANSILQPPDPFLSPFSVLSGSDRFVRPPPGMPGIEMGERDPSASNNTGNCFVIMDQSGPFGPCFRVDDFNATVQTALCKFITAPSALDPPANQADRAEMCHAYETVRNNCLDMTRDHLAIDLGQIGCARENGGR